MTQYPTTVAPGEPLDDYARVRIDLRLKELCAMDPDDPFLQKLAGLIEADTVLRRIQNAEKIAAQRAEMLDRVKWTEHNLCTKFLGER